jgi:hypothetical protein
MNLNLLQYRALLWIGTRIPGAARWAFGARVRLAKRILGGCIK